MCKEHTMGTVDNAQGSEVTLQVMACKMLKNNYLWANNMKKCFIANNPAQSFKEIKTNVLQHGTIFEYVALTK